MIGKMDDRDRSEEKRKIGKGSRSNMKGKTSLEERGLFWFCKRPSSAGVGSGS
jgi:hypothetical protein